jgi:signal transduction histidine kinase
VKDEDKTVELEISETERKRVEEELRDAQEQLIRKERLAILGQLAGGVGHELRNPLGVISNAVYYLKTTLPDADETTKEYLEMISAEVHDAEKIVSDLLDLSRTKPAESEEIAVSQLVTQVLDSQPPPKKVKVTTKS